MTANVRGVRTLASLRRLRTALLSCDRRDRSSSSIIVRVLSSSSCSLKTLTSSACSETEDLRESKQQIDLFHGKYLSEVLRIFEEYKRYNPDYAAKTLVFE